MQQTPKQKHMYVTYIYIYTYIFKKKIYIYIYAMCDITCTCVGTAKMKQRDTKSRSIEDDKIEYCTYCVYLKTYMYIICGHIYIYIYIYKCQILLSIHIFRLHTICMFYEIFSLDNTFYMRHLSTCVSIYCKRIRRLQ